MTKIVLISGKHCCVCGHPSNLWGSWAVYFYGSCDQPETRDVQRQFNKNVNLIDGGGGCSHTVHELCIELMWSMNSSDNGSREMCRSVSPWPKWKIKMPSTIIDFNILKINFPLDENCNNTIMMCTTYWCLTTALNLNIHSSTVHTLNNAVGSRLWSTTHSARACVRPTKRTNI